MTKKYEMPNFQVVLFEDNDVILASNPGGDPFDIQPGSGGNGGSTDPWSGEA